MADLWSDYTDMLITRIDAVIKDKYGPITLRTLLGDPGSFADQQGLDAMVSNLKKDVDSYIDNALEQLGGEVADAEKQAANADALTKQLASIISAAAAQARVPVLSLAYFDHDGASDESLYVNNADASVSLLVEKLLASCSYITYSFNSYKQYQIGEWLFSGPKNRVLGAYLETTEVMNLANSRQELDGLLEAASTYVSTL